MRTDRYLFSGLVALLMVSCNYDEFQLDKYTKITGLDPVVYLPVSSGTYAVADYTAFPETGLTPVTADSLNFKVNNQPVIPYPFNGLTIDPEYSDSIWVIIKTVNETPMKFRYWLSYPGKTMQSPILNAAIVNAAGVVVTASRDSIEYKLNTNDVNNLKTATGMNLAITLYKPGTPVIANALKPSQISIKIAFRAPFNVFKFQ